MSNELTTAQFQLMEITGTAFVPRTFRLRYDVWRTEATLKADVIARGVITDEHDAHARHWAIFTDDQIVAAARMCVHGCHEDTPDSPAFTTVRLPVPIATINRLVVHQSVRNHGLAEKLDTCRIEAAKQDGAKCVIATAVQNRTQALIRRGFRLTGTRWNQPYSSSLLFHAMILDLQ